MNFSQIFRNFLGIPDLRPRDNSFEGPPGAGDIPNGNEFRNPIWNLDGDDDDDDDLRTPSPPFGFQVFTNPIEMHRFFEHQLGEIIRGFQSQMFDLPSSFGLPQLEMPPDRALDPGEERGGGNLRDKYLKPGFKTVPQQPVPWFSRDEQSDTDLDERIKVSGLDSVLGERSQVLPGNTPSANNGFQTRIFGRSIVTQTVRRSDGTTEHHRTVRDNEGNEEITVTHQVGDQRYTKTTTVDASGVQKQTENFVNIDENSLSDFEQRWKKRIDGSGATDTDRQVDGAPKPHNWFPFDKFF